MQVIIHSNGNGGIAICVPTGEISIEEVLAKDCPPDSVIVDDSVLPQGADAQFFDAWFLDNGKISVNFSKAQAIKLKVFNDAALQVAQARQLNTLAGLPNDPDDVTFLKGLSDGRNSIANATTTAELLAIPNPV